MIPRLYIARTSDGNDFPLPSYTSRYHVGLNLMAAIGSPLKINTGERVRIPVGFAIGIPDGYCGQIVSVPEMSEKYGLIVSDAPRIIHPANREPLFVLLQNTSPHQFILHRADIIAQIIITPVVQVCWNEIEADINGPTTSSDEILLDDPNETNVSTQPSTNKTQNSKVPEKREHKSIRNRYKKNADGL